MFIRALILLQFILVFSVSAFAAEIFKIGKTKVVVKLDGSNYDDRQMLEALDKEGNQVAIIEVVKSNSKYAIAKIIKGKPRKGLIVEKLAAADVPVAEPKKEKEEPVAAEDEEMENEPEEEVAAREESAQMGSVFVGSFSIISEKSVNFSSYGFNLEYGHMLANNVQARYGVVYWDGSDSNVQLTSTGAHLTVNYLVNMSPAAKLELGAFLGYESIAQKVIANGNLTEAAEAGMVLGPVLGVLFDVNEKWAMAAELKIPSYSLDTISLSPMAMTMAAFYKF